MYCSNVNAIKLSIGIFILTLSSQFFLGFIFANWYAPIATDIEYHVNIIIFTWYSINLMLLVLFISAYPNKRFNARATHKKENIFAKIVLFISIIIVIYVINIIYNLTSSGDIKEILLFDAVDLNIRSVQIIISKLSMVLMIYYAFFDKKLFLIYMSTFFFIELSVLSRSFMPIIYASIIFLSIRGKKRYIPFTVVLLLSLAVLVGSFQGRGGVSFERVAYKLYQYTTYSYLMPSHYYKDIKNVSYTSILFGFPAIKVNKMLGNVNDGKFESEYLMQPYWVQWDGDLVPANVRLSTPILYYYTGGVAGLLFGLVFNILIFFIIFIRFSPYVMLIFFYLIVVKGVYIFQLNGISLISTLMLIIFFLNKFNIKTKPFKYMN
jgi:hypothetical protein